jgi:hypothetical protein
MRIDCVGRVYVISKEKTIKMIEESQLEKSIEELMEFKTIKLEIELSAFEAYSLIVAFQISRAKSSNLPSVLMAGEAAARRLHGLLGDSCPRTYILLNNGWNLTESKPNLEETL